ncbi:MAG: N-acetylglucosamine-6-phosphate deacetylase [Lachnospiraceae bacterium]|nr:N-acetylglucosamine-6-phosphate deacetylase [Lachnospiraceae bacterium]
MLIKNGLVYTEDFTFEKKNIRIQNGIITKIYDGEADVTQLDVYEKVIDASGKKIIPGLTDIHFHGCVGYDFCDGSEEAISAMAKYQLSIGVTNICPATMTLSKERLMEICKAAAEHVNKDDEADLVGINLEGPFISPDKVGAQNPEFVHRADEKFLQDLILESGGLTKLCTIAPEEEGAIDCIKALKGNIRFSIGHTCADYDSAKAAYDVGACHVTHLFNAMPAFTHRAPGVIGAAADDSKVMAEMICDGIHVHPSAIRTAFKMFGDDRIVLISDSTRACGMPDGEYELGGLPIFKKDGAARLADGTLAGSATNVYDCMLNVIKMGIPEETAVKAATYNPAKAIGILDRTGSIAEGKEAKLVIVDNDYSIVEVIK